MYRLVRQGDVSPCGGVTKIAEVTSMSGNFLRSSILCSYRYYINFGEIVAWILREINLPSRYTALIFFVWV